MLHSIKASKVSLYGLIICGLSTLFYVYDFVLRIMPSSIFPELVLRYNLSPAKLGLLSSLFFLGYLIMQLPCGLLYDKFGTRVVMTVSLLIASLAALTFLATPYFSIAIISRFFMGFGSAFAYIGPLVLVSQWLPKKYYALSAGAIQFMGSIGAIIGESPISKLVAIYGVKQVVFVIGICGVVLAIIFALFIKNNPETMQKRKVSVESIFAPLHRTLKISQNWIVAFYGFSIWAPIAIFAALWAVPFFKFSLNISTTHAAFISSFIWIGVAIGGPLFSAFSNWTISRRKPLFLAALLGLVSSSLILYCHLSISFACILCFIFGLSSSAQAVTFGLVADNNRSFQIGTASAFNNMAIVSGGLIFQPIVGLLLQLHHGFDKNIYMSTHSDFAIALSIIPICYFLSLMTVSFFIKETHCRNVY